MADDKKDDTNKDEGKLTVAHLRTMIREEISNLIPSGVGGSDKTDKVDDKTSVAPDLKTLVQTELGKLRSREQREQRDKEIDERLKTLEQPKEKTPVERSRWHKIMGWGEPE